MSPLNRRGFLVRCVGVALSAIALKPSVSDAIKWKTRLWIIPRAPIHNTVFSANYNVGHTEQYHLVNLNRPIFP